MTIVEPAPTPPSTDSVFAELDARTDRHRRRAG